MSNPNLRGSNPKGGYAPASFAKLLAVAGAGNGEPLRISLADIDEDPNQPRKVIDGDDLAPLAATIRSHGVLQPIGVHPPVDGRYRLAFGARRLRASKIAEQLDIPAIIVLENQRTYATQVIENQQRANLSNSDLAAAVHQLYTEGASIEQVQSICNLTSHTVKAYRAVQKFPAFLVERLDTADIRALYELYRQWTKTPAEVEAGMPDKGSYVTITDARRVIGSIATAPPSASAEPPVVDQLDQKASTTAEPVKEDNEERKLHAAGQVEIAKPELVYGSPAPAPKQVQIEVGAEQKISKGVVVAIGEGEHGQLVIDRQPQSEGWGFVRYPTGIEEVELRHLRIVAIG